MNHGALFYVRQLYSLAWLVWLVIYFRCVRLRMNGILEYLKANKHERFIEITGGSNHFPTWRRWYGTFNYAFSTKDNDDKAATGYKSAYTRFMWMNTVITFLYIAVDRALNRLCGL